MAGYNIQVDDTVKAADLEQIYRVAGPYAADAEASDAYVITVVPAVDTLLAGMIFHFKANTANTGACTLNVNGKGAKTIKKNYNVDLDDGDIKANQMVTVIYDGTNFQLISRVNTNTIILTHVNGVDSRTGDTASGDQTIAHGLGTTPDFIRLTARKHIGTVSSVSDGVYNGTTISCVWAQPAAGANSSSSNLIYIIDTAGNLQSATVAVDDTNITLTWTKTGTPSANIIFLMWEAQVFSK